MKKLVGECIGTFALVFAGTGAIVINDVSSGTITHAGIALTFGLIVLSMVYTFGDTSGAHLNPAVTLGFWAARRFLARDVTATSRNRFDQTWTPIDLSRGHRLANPCILCS